MPYPPNGGPRRIPVTREIVSTEFERADGQVVGQTHFAKVVGSSPTADVDSQVLQRKVELACGCFWPDADAAGVCAVCAAEGRVANVCKPHFAICTCGAACCWRHSRPSADPAVRLCERCNLRRKIDDRATAAISAVGRIARCIFTTDQPPHSESEP